MSRVPFVDVCCSDANHRYRKQLAEKEKEFKTLEKTGKNTRDKNKLASLSSEMKRLKSALKEQERKKAQITATEARLKAL